MYAPRFILYFITTHLRGWTRTLPSCDVWAFALDAENSFECHSLAVDHHDCIHSYWWRVQVFDQLLGRSFVGVLLPDCTRATRTAHKGAYVGEVSVATTASSSQSHQLIHES